MNEALIQTKEIGKKEYMVCCPNCGKFQYRVWGEGGITFQCERCKTGVEVIYADGQITLRDKKSKGESQMPRIKTARVAW